MKKPSATVLLGYAVWAVSFVIGLVATLFIVWVLFDTKIERYGTNYFVLTVLSIMFIILIWLDYLAGTKILPD